MDTVELDQSYMHENPAPHQDYHEPHAEPHAPETLVLTRADNLFEDTASDKSLDMVRNILFGEQVRENERRQATLERFVKVWVNSIREEQRKQVDALKHEIALLRDLLAEENKARLGDVQIARERFDQHGSSLDDLGRQIQSAQHDLHQRIDHETGRIGHEMGQQRQDLLNQLQQATDQLRHAKADRTAIASLLGNVARQLTEDMG